MVKETSYAQAVQEQEEGTVLLYNKDGALPLKEDELQGTLFGHAVVQPLYRNSSAGSRAYDSMSGVDLYKALGAVGFKVNPGLYNAYRQSATARNTGTATSFFAEGDGGNSWSLGEEPIEFYTDEIKATWADQFNKVAIVMFARQGGRGRGAPDGNAHRGHQPARPFAG